MHAKTFPIWHFMHKCRCLQRWLIDPMKIKFIKQNAKCLPATVSVRLFYDGFHYILTVAQTKLSQHCTTID